MKKIFGILSLGIVSLGLIAPIMAQTPPAGSVVSEKFGLEGNNAINGGFAVAGGTDATQGDSIITVVKRIINYALGFLGLIVLIMLLYGGFNMVTAGADDEKYKEGFKILKNAAIGIGFIGLSWFFVSFIFYVFDLVAGT